MTVDSLIKRLKVNTAKYADKEALTFLGSGPNGGKVENRFSYNDIESETDKLALGLLGAGLSKGDL